MNFNCNKIGREEHKSNIACGKYCWGQLQHWLCHSTHHVAPLKSPLPPHSSIVATNESFIFCISCHMTAGSDACNNVVKLPRRQPHEDRQADTERQRRQREKQREAERHSWKCTQSGTVHPQRPRQPRLALALPGWKNRGRMRRGKHTRALGAIKSASSVSGAHLKMPN